MSAPVRIRVRTEDLAKIKKSPFKISGLIRIAMRDMEQSLLAALAATFSMPGNMTDVQMTQTTITVEDEDLAELEAVSTKTGISKDAIIRLLMMLAAWAGQLVGSVRSPYCF